MDTAIKNYIIEKTNKLTELFKISTIYEKLLENMFMNNGEGVAHLSSLTLVRREDTILDDSIRVINSISDFNSKTMGMTVLEKLLFREPYYSQINDIVISSMVPHLDNGILSENMDKVKEKLYEYIPQFVKESSPVIINELLKRTIELHKCFHYLADTKLLVLDTETTDLDRKLPVQIAYIYTDIDLNIITSGNFYINQKNISEKAIEKHGLTEEKLLELKAIQPIWYTHVGVENNRDAQLFKEIISDKPIIIAHNSWFDIEVIKSFYRQIGIPMPENRNMCTYKRRGYLNKDLEDYKLETITNAYIDKASLDESYKSIFKDKISDSSDSFHNAMYDTTALYNILKINSYLI